MAQTQAYNQQPNSFSDLYPDRTRDPTRSLARNLSFQARYHARLLTFPRAPFDFPLASDGVPDASVPQLPRSQQPRQPVVPRAMSRHHRQQPAQCPWILTWSPLPPGRVVIPIRHQQLPSANSNNQHTRSSTASFISNPSTPAEAKTPSPVVVSSSSLQQQPRAPVHPTISSVISTQHHKGLDPSSLSSSGHRAISITHNGLQQQHSGHHERHRSPLQQASSTTACKEKQKGNKH